MNSSDYTLQAVKGIKEVMKNAMGNMLTSFMDNRVIDFYITNEDDEIFTSIEGLTGIESLGEEETPPSLALEDGYTATFSPSRFGGAIVIPEKVYAVDKGDPTTKVDIYLKEQRNQLLRSIQNKLLIDAFYMLNNGHNSGALTLAPDSVELYGSHTWATGGTFDNSATAALDADAIDDMEEFGGDFYDPTDTDRPFDHDYNIITVKKGSDNARMAKRLFAGNISPISVADINIYEGGGKTIVETPYYSTAAKNYWEARDSKFPNSLILGINRVPALRDPIKGDNEAIRSNVTGFWKRGIKNIPHDRYGSNGST